MVDSDVLTVDLNGDVDPVLIKGNFEVYKASVESGGKKFSGLFSAFDSNCSDFVLRVSANSGKMKIFPIKFDKI